MEEKVQNYIKKLSDLYFDACAESLATHRKWNIEEGPVPIPQYVRDAAAIRATILGEIIAYLQAEYAE